MLHDKFIWLAALAATQGVLSAPADSSAADKPVNGAPDYLPRHVQDRWDRCHDLPDTPLSSSSHPCTRVNNIVGSIQVNTLGGHKASAPGSEMQKFSHALLNASSGYVAAWDCCRKCKKANGIHSDEEDVWWEKYHSKENVDAWKEAVDKAASRNQTVQILNDFLWDRRNQTWAPAITPEEQAKSDLAVPESQYCGNAPKILPNIEPSDKVVVVPAGTASFCVISSILAETITAVTYRVPCVAVGKPGSMSTVCGAPVKEPESITMKRSSEAEKQLVKAEECPACAGAPTASGAEVMKKSMAASAQNVSPALEAAVRSGIVTEVSVSAAVNIIFKSDSRVEAERPAAGKAKVEEKPKAAGTSKSETASEPAAPQSDPVVEEVLVC
ncbi:hypothetical protein GQ602_003950 [Ophiocordyceps camponoti-floridani]|uniref:Uncharacterized protein n=1 Tax=Ophiocordyceps camponoti-floridani TaxID=2030778 RepID=A0A8H4VD51_9HYPO|nr:hypothetical protein GQ602_003950 [Ophiocordyceps camponoti-floridani]